MTALPSAEIRRRANADGVTVIEHAWPTVAAECRAIQQALSGMARTEDDLPASITRIAGVDIGFEDRGQTTRAAVVVLDAETLEPVESRLVRQPTRLPYIPGLLSFREVPATLEALGALSRRPDLLLVDGHGIAHPRRLGVATHLALVSGYPAIGVAKKRLVGTHAAVADRRGAWTPLEDGDETIGAVLRSRVHVKPIFISTGHRVSLESALMWTGRALTRYRLPETTRQADRLASGR